MYMCTHAYVYVCRCITAPCCGTPIHPNNSLPIKNSRGSVWDGKLEFLEYILHNVLYYTNVILIYNL